MKPKFLFLLLINLQIFSQEPIELRFEDKVRIKEAFEIAQKHGDKIWDNFSSVPFVILLVTPGAEYLINHPNPSADFVLTGEDDFLKRKVYQRKRVFDSKLLATFPAVNGVPTIVVGTPENTGKNSTEWIITLLHEHFHQYQMSHPAYYKDVNNLDLAGGDESGMWMLNYPFPYDSLPVLGQYKNYVNALQAVLTAPTKEENNSHLQRYIIQRKHLKDVLKPADYRYLSFQIWQEGMAKYTEYKFLELLATDSTSTVYNTLSDFIPYKELKEHFFRSEISNLTNLLLNKAHRVAFYSLGFAEGLLLDELNKDWEKEYLEKKFFIENYASQFSF